MLRALIRHWIPERFADPSHPHKVAAKLLVVFGVHSLFFGPLMAATLLFLNAPYSALSSFIAAASAPFSAWYFSRTSNLQQAGLIFIGGQFANAAIVILLNGGPSFMGIGYLSICPVLAVLLLGRRQGLLWMFVVLLFVLLLAILLLRGIVLPSELNSEGRHHFYMLVMSMLFVMSFFIARAHEQVQQNVVREMQRISDVKSQFVANVSHELRTPLHGILGMADALKSSKLDQKQQEHLSIIHDSTEKLMGLVNDLLDLSKLNAGKMLLNNEAVSVAQLLDETLRIIRPLASVKQLPLQLELGVDLPPVIVVDALRIQQVLLNLLSNAVKFTEQGTVTVALTHHIDPDGSSLLRFAVKDTGVGIPSHFIGKLFSEFQQVESQHDRRFTGTGLGLSIARKLVELHRGNIGVESEIGMGSCFWFQLPIQNGVLATPSLSPLQVVFQFYPLQQSALWRLHALACGAVVTISPDLSHSAAADIVLMQGNGHCLVCDADQKELAQLRFDATVDDFVRALITPVQSTQVEPPANLTPLRLHADVLVVDDNEVNRKVVQTLLEKRHCTVHTASSGEIALAMCQVHEFDLIFMDCQMPEMDGFACTTQLRMAGVKTPIIALSANVQASDKVACLAAGMDDFLPKPAGADKLYRCVEQYAKKRAS